MSDDDFQSDFYYADEEETCDHEDAEVDLFEGRLYCACGYTKWLDTEELNREAELQAELYRAFHHESEGGAIDMKQQPGVALPVQEPIRSTKPLHLINDGGAFDPGRHPNLRRRSDYTETWWKSFWLAAARASDFRPHTYEEI